MKRFILIGGNPFRPYTGTTTYTSLKVIGTAHSKEEIRKLYQDNYENCAGLLLVVEAETGKECQNLLSVDELKASIDDRCKSLDLNEKAVKYIWSVFKFGLNEIDSANRFPIKRDDATDSMWFSATMVFAAILGFTEEDPLTNPKFKNIWETFYIEIKPV